eukprot:7103971-Pyramimonas_sp.AAC.1
MLAQAICGPSSLTEKVVRFLGARSDCVCTLKRITPLLRIYTPEPWYTLSTCMPSRANAV